VSATDSHEKKTTYPGRDHQKAADCRRGHGRRQDRGGYSGVKKDALKRLRELEKENIRLKKLVADQALDMAILKEVAEGKW